MKVMTIILWKDYFEGSEICQGQQSTEGEAVM